MAPRGVEVTATPWQWAVLSALVYLVAVGLVVSDLLRGRER